MKYAAPPECCKCGDCQLVPPQELRAWDDHLQAVKRGIATADTLLAGVKLEIAKSAGSCLGQGSLDEDAQKQIGWANDINAAREIMLAAYKALSSR